MCLSSGVKDGPISSFFTVKPNLLLRQSQPDSQRSHERMVHNTKRKVLILWCTLDVTRLPAPIRPPVPLAASKPAILGTRSNRNPSILACTIWLWCVLWFSGWELYCFSGRIWFLLMDLSTGVRLGGWWCSSGEFNQYFKAWHHRGEIRRSARNQQQSDAMNHDGNVSQSSPPPAPNLIGSVQSCGTGRATFRPGSMTTSLPGPRWIRNVIVITEAEVESVIGTWSLVQKLKSWRKEINFLLNTI